MVCNAIYSLSSTLSLSNLTTTVGVGPNIELVRGNTTSANYNWNILNNDNLLVQNKNLATAYTTKIEISSAGNTAIRTTTSTSYKLAVGVSINVEGYIYSDLDVILNSLVSNSLKWGTTNSLIVRETHAHARRRSWGCTPWRLFSHDVSNVFTRKTKWE